MYLFDNLSLMSWIPYFGLVLTFALLFIFRDNIAQMKEHMKRYVREILYNNLSTQESDTWVAGL